MFMFMFIPPSLCLISSWPLSRYRVRRDQVWRGWKRISWTEAEGLQLQGSYGERRHRFGYERALQCRSEGTRKVFFVDFFWLLFDSLIPVFIFMHLFPNVGLGVGIPDHPSRSGRDLLSELWDPGPGWAHNQPGPRQHWVTGTRPCRVSTHSHSVLPLNLTQSTTQIPIYWPSYLLPSPWLLPENF